MCGCRRRGFNRIYPMGMHRSGIRGNRRDGERYGFIYVDKDNQGNGTLKRSKKDSFEWYKNVIKSNGEIL